MLRGSNRYLHVVNFSILVQRTVDIDISFRVSGERCAKHAVCSKRCTFCRDESSVKTTFLPCKFMHFCAVYSGHFQLVSCVSRTLCKARCLLLSLIVISRCRQRENDISTVSIYAFLNSVQWTFSTRFVCQSNVVQSTLSALNDVRFGEMNRA